MKRNLVFYYVDMYMVDDLSFDGFTGDKVPTYNRELDAGTSNQGEKIHLTLVDDQTSFKDDIIVKTYINCQRINRFIYTDSINCSDRNKNQKAQQLINEATIYVEKMIKEFRNYYSSITSSVKSNNISNIRLNDETVFRNYETSSHDPSTFIFDIIYDRDYQIYVGDTTITPDNNISTKDDWSQCKDVSGQHELVVLYKTPNRNEFEAYRNVSGAKRDISNKLNSW